MPRLTLICAAVAAALAAGPTLANQEATLQSARDAKAAKEAEARREEGWQGALSQGQVKALLGDHDTAILGAHPQGSDMVFIADHASGRYKCRSRSSNYPKPESSEVRFVCWPFPGVEVTDKTFAKPGQ